MNEEEKNDYCYLGDGVYAFFDGDGIWLRTHHPHELLCDDKIYLEPNVLKKLNIFNENVRKYSEHRT